MEIGFEIIPDMRSAFNAGSKNFAESKKWTRKTQMKRRIQSCGTQSGRWSTSMTVSNRYRGP